MLVFSDSLADLDFFLGILWGFAQAPTNSIYLLETKTKVLSCPALTSATYQDSEGS